MRSVKVRIKFILQSIQDKVWPMKSSHIILLVLLFPTWQKSCRLHKVPNFSRYLKSKMNSI